MFGAIERHVERAVVAWIGRAAAPRPGVVGREHAADEGDQGEALRLVVAQRIDVPPGIAARRDRAVEAESASTLAAASRPEIAAIGTPAPGWVLPPAR